MGSFKGHVLPGSLFLLVGLWHLVGCISKYVARPRNFRGRVWHAVGSGRFKHLEIYVVVVGALTDMCIEFFYSTHRRFIVDGGLNTKHLNDFEHAAMLLMFFIFGVTTLVKETTGALPLPEGGLNVVAAMAFAAEFLLFHFHSTSHAGLEGRYHEILVILIGLCILGALLGALFPRSFPIDLGSSVALTMQGAWFYQTAFSLYGSMVPAGCRHESTGIECDSSDSEERGQTLANVQLALHMSSILILVAVVYGVCARLWGHSELQWDASSHPSQASEKAVDTI